MLAAPRRRPGEADLGPAIDTLGGEVVRLRSRDGVRLAARWVPGERTDDGWQLDEREAILLLHGYTGSVAPDLLEYGPFLRGTASVLGLDFRGHGDSDDGPTTFGALEVEDVAGALSWLGERGVERVAMHGLSMGGVTAIAAVAVLGDGRLASADMDLDAPSDVPPPPRPRIVAVVADSAAPDVVIPVASRMGVPGARFLADRLFDAAARTIGADPRETEPGRVIALVEPVPLLLIHGEADDTVPIAAGRRLAVAAGPSAEHWVVSGAGHSLAHATDPTGYEDRVTAFIRHAFLRARDAPL
jgi:pimeloyl-ACP methyl ester carboxylesterase